ncbi:MAG: hypothetical protein D8H93_16130 [Capnocytophaga sp.]|nr:MAG: hypothetical protein D8H93_16130 [Capnocytophaga sp.]
MKVKLFNLILLLLPCIGSAQKIYMDPVTAGAMAGYAITLKGGHERAEKEQDKLQKAQTFISAQVTLVKKVQDKVYKGLSEAGGTIQNAIQVKNIGEEIKQCAEYSKNISQLVERHPQYAIFGAKATQRCYEQTLKIANEMSNILADGETNLATAGDRYRVLDNIEQQVRMLKIYLISVQLALENAEYAGFWKSINPFQGYIDTDKDIIQNIMKKFKHQF